MRFTKSFGLTAAAGLAAAAIALSPIASARSTQSKGSDTVREVEPGPPYEEVDSFWMYSRPYSWTAIDEKTVIVWASAFDPYMIKLAYPSHDLKWVESIGVTSFGNRVYAKFDSLQVRGFRYPIDSIYKMSREEARNLARAS
jgi:Family of unknown function (DUF6491)